MPNPRPSPPPPSPPPPSPLPPSPRPNILLIRVLTVLVALTGLLLTFFLARTGRETVGVVAVMTALVPLMLSLNRQR